MAIPKDMSDQTAAPQEDFVQTAGVISDIARRATGQILKPLTKRGQRLDPNAIATDAVPAPDVSEMPLGPRIDLVPDLAEPPQPVAPQPVTIEEMRSRVAARQEEIGTPREVPSPSIAQLDEGLVKGPVNTSFYDDDGLAATIQSAAKAADDGSLAIKKPVTMDEIYDGAIEAGVPKENLDAIFSGEGIQSGVGLDQLSQKMSGLVVLQKASSLKLDELLALAQRGELDIAGQMDLRETIAQHDIILAALSGAQTDIARSMNVFKGIRGKGASASLKEVREHLENLGGADQLRVLAEAYNSTNSPASRNKLIRNSARKKTYESMVYMAQSVMLNDPVTHFYNAAGNALMLFMDVPERALAVPIGSLRQKLYKIAGKTPDPDKYYMDDIIARSSGVRNGLLDGWALFGEKLKKGGAVKDAARSPLRTDYWAGAEYKIPFTKKVRQVPDLTDNVIGKTFNAMGLYYSMPFRALGAADEFFGGVAQRVQLHEDAARLGGQTFDSVFEQLKQMGADERTAQAQALEAAQTQVQKLISERPDDISASMEGWRKQVTLQEDIDPSLPLAFMYQGIEKKLNTPLLKPLAPFSKTLTNIANMGAAKGGPLAFFSPAFYAEVRKGGRHLDLAISRAALGGSMVWAGYELANSDAITGAGPADTGLRNDMKARGWRPFSYKIPKSIFGPRIGTTPDQVQKIIDVLGEENIIPGTGEEFGDYYFVSMKRVDPANMPLLMGAAIADAARFKEYDEDNTNFDIAFSAAMAGAAEYATALPALQTFGEIVSIANQRNSDVGDRIAATASAIQKRYVSFYVSGTPIAGITNSTLVARLERIVDPTVSDVGVGPDYPAALVGFGEAMNRWRSRIPYYSKDVPNKLDVWGDEIGTTEAPSYQPISIGVGKNDELKEFLSVIQYSIPEVPRYFDGVKIPPDVKRRFTQLYAKEIMIDGMTLVDGITQGMNEYLDDFGMDDPDFSIGRARSLIENIVGKYRKLAKQRMFGELVEDPLDPNQYEYSLTPADLSDYGLADADIEFPEFAEKLAKAKNKKLFPQLVGPKKPTLQGILD